MNGNTFRLIASLVGLFLAASACSFGTTSATPSNKTLVVESSFEFDSLDPARGSALTVYQALIGVYQTLLQQDEKDTTKLNPGLAESYVASADGLSVTFKLRHDVRFSDGTPMTADDVVFTFNRVKNMKGAPQIWVAGLTTTAVDKYTVLVTSATPNVYIASHLVIPLTGIENSKVVMAHGGSAAADADKTDTAEQFLNQASAGSGPYVLDSVVANSQIVLKTNPNYWGSKPAYSKIIMVNTPATTQLLDIQKNPNTIVLNLSPHDASTLDKSKFNFLTAPALETFAIALNADPAISKVTANFDIRQAVRFGIDYNTLLNIAGLGAIRARGILAPGIAGAMPASQVVTQDVAKAKALVAQSGLSNPTFALDYPSDETPNGISYAVLAQQIQANLKDIGITVNLVPAPRVVFAAKWKASKSQAVLTAMAGSSYDAAAALFYSAGRVVGKWMGWSLGQDPTTDGLVAQIVATTDKAKQETLFAQEQAATNNFAVFIPLFNAALVMVSSKSVGGLNLNGIDNFRAWEMT